MKQSDRTLFLAFAMGLMSGSMLAEPIYQGVFANAGTVEILEDDEFFSGSLGKSLGGVFEGEDGVTVHAGFWASQDGSSPQTKLSLNPESMRIVLESQGGVAARGKIFIDGTFNEGEDYEAYIAFVIPGLEGSFQSSQSQNSPLNVSVDEGAVWVGVESKLIQNQFGASMELDLVPVLNSFPELGIVLGEGEEVLEYQLFLRIHQVSID